MEIKDVIQYIKAMPAKKYEAAKRLEDTMHIKEDGKLGNARADLVSIVNGIQNDDRPVYENPTKYLSENEHWQILRRWAVGEHNDVSLDLKETLGLVRTAYTGLFKIFKETVEKVRAYGANAKDRWALCGSG